MTTIGKMTSSSLLTTTSSFLGKMTTIAEDPIDAIGKMTIFPIVEDDVDREDDDR